MENGGQVWLMGSPNDAEDCAAIEALAPGVMNLAGRTGLAELIALLARASVVLCNENNFSSAHRRAADRDLIS